MRLALCLAGLLAFTACSSNNARQPGAKDLSGLTLENVDLAGADLMSMPGEDLSANMSLDLYGYEAGIGAYGDLGINGDASGCAPGQAPMACPSPLPANDGCGPVEICGNGADDNCDGQVDENCSCNPGDVQRCFLGPPLKRGVGACTDGTQTCVGATEFGHWGDCVGSIGPSPEVCDKLDNDCDGCVDDGLCCGSALSCPAPGDPRIAPVLPYTDLQLKGELFFFGNAKTWTWTVTGGPCDQLFASPGFTPSPSPGAPPPQSFTLTNANTQDATVHFTLSGDYTVTMTVVDTAGNKYTCKWVQHVEGPGVRFELCWDHQGTAAQGGADLDLHVHRATGATPWFFTYTTTRRGTAVSDINPDDCFYYNCTAGEYTTPPAYPDLQNPFIAPPAPSWGYNNSTPDTYCHGSKYGAIWDMLGYCHNPRLDLDNITDVGVPENSNIDNPGNGDSFRALVHYYGQGGGNSTASVDEHPIVNVYCGGVLKATYGQAPNQLSGFNTGGALGSNRTGPNSSNVWRVADVVAAVDGSGNTTGCTITAIHPSGMTSGYDVETVNPSTAAVPY